MKKAKSKVDSVNGTKAVALGTTRASQVHVIESEAFKFFNGPVGQHDPRED